MAWPSGIPITPKNDYSIKLGGQRYGFVDYDIGYGPGSHVQLLRSGPTAHVVGPTRVHLGPFGVRSLPVSALSGWALVLAVPIVLVVLARVVRTGNRARLANARTTLSATHE
jgi:hypothetical protein